MIKLSVACFLMMAVPLYGQLPGDVNCNGFPYEVADAVFAVMLLMHNCSLDSVADCTLENGEIDGDGISLTIADVAGFYYAMGGVPSPDFPRHPDSDTLFLASANASPGDQLRLPLFLSSVDTLTAFQFYIVADTNYVRIDSFEANQDFQFGQLNCQENSYACSFDYRYDNNPIMFIPGSYHLGDLIVDVRPDLNNPVSTQLTFSDDPDFIRYTGLANLTFFRPVLVNSEIHIVPVGVEASDDSSPPRDAEISCYPNPFNRAVSIAVSCPRVSELVITDILGRSIKSFTLEAGKRTIEWDGRGADGDDVGSGVYFAGLKTGQSFWARPVKITYLK